MTIGTSVPLPAYTYDPAVIAKKAEDLGYDRFGTRNIQQCRLKATARSRRQG